MSPISGAAPPPPAGAGDLHAFAGFDVALVSGGDGPGASPELRFGPSVSAPPPAQRTRAEMRPFLREPPPASAAAPESPSAAASDERDVLYTVYRGVAPAEAQDAIEQRGLLYVALVMRPGTIAAAAGPDGADDGDAEWVRTRGHTNSLAAGTPIPFPEVHEVWHGRALAYLQKEAAPDVSDVVTVLLGPGDKIVIPPGWASLMVNVDPDRPLAFGSWRPRDCVPRYTDLEALGGMAHFVIAEPARADRPFRFEPNTRYRNAPIPRAAPARDYPEFGLQGGTPMLTTFRRNPDFFRFLARPQDHDAVWSGLYRE